MQPDILLYVKNIDSKPLEQFRFFCLIIPIAICMRNVATGIVLSLLLCIYICFFCLLVFFGLPASGEIKMHI